MLKRGYRGVRDLEDSPLCCCEYINLKGQRTHLLAFCCECDAFDDTVDNLTKGEGVSKHQLATLLEQIVDRVRIPTHRGAMKLNADIIVPFVTLFTVLLFGSYSLLTTVIAMIILQTVMTSFLIKILTQKKPSNFFVSWAISASVLGYGCYMRYKAMGSCPDIFEVVALHIIFVLFWVSFVVCRQDPGVVGRVRRETTNSDYVRLPQTPPENRSQLNGSAIMEPMTSSSGGVEYFDIARHGETGVVEDIPEKYVAYDGSRELHIRLPRGYEVTLDMSWNEEFPSSAKSAPSSGSVWCKRCEVWVPPRTVHCRTCQHCVLLLDHHCVWLNTCVGWNNQRSFVAVMLLFIVGTVWGSVSTLRCICYNPVTTTTGPVYPCWDVYESFSTSFPFVCAIYAVFVAMFICLLLIRQVILLSVGVTWAEFSRTWVKHKSLAPAIRDMLKHNRNSLARNWLIFLTNTHTPPQNTCYPLSHV